MTTTTKIFYSGDVIEHDGENYQCICADSFAAVFGKIKNNEDDEHSTITSCEDLFALSNEGPTLSCELLLKDVKETNIPGFRSREHDKDEFKYRIVFRNSWAVSEEGAPEIPEAKEEIS